ncbi:MAG: hypothetical protein AAB449_00055 [Patescibacteria group bacterium]
MSKETAVIVLGVWVIIVPQLGIPSPWRTALLILSGLALIVIGLYLRAESHSRRPRKSDQPFVEHLSAQADTASIAADYSEHEHKDGTTQVN